MKCLDLFCGAGGASVGLHNAGFDVIGVDINAQFDYPYEFIQADALRGWDFGEFDLIWASPPCQGYIPYLTEKARAKYPKLIEPVRKMLLDSKKPFVIENVPGAPLRKDLLLCGAMFGLKVIRHRIFEIHGFDCDQPVKRCIEHKGKVISGEFIGVYGGGRPGCFGNKELRNKLKSPTLETASLAMGINHMTNFSSIKESIPPAYAEYIGREFLKHRFIK